MGEHQYKVGDRVMRTDCRRANASIDPGVLGTVVEIQKTGLSVRWDVSANSHATYGGSSAYWPLECIALVSSAPTPELPASVEPQLVSAKPDLWERIVVLEAALSATRQQLADAIQAKTNFGDVIGERDSLRRELAEQATRMVWLERELVRVTGKAKGNR